MPHDLLLIGYGRMGQALAAVVRDEIAGMSIVGVVDTRPDLDQLLDRDFDEPVPGFADLDSAITSTDARACVIASPTSMHAEHVARALAASMDVFCEKPLTLDPGSSDELGSTAHAAGRILQVGFYRRFSPPWIAAKEILRSGEIGDTIFLRATAFDGSMPPLSFANPAVSGGLAIDNGVHEYDSLAWLLESEVVGVHAQRGPDPAGALSSVGDEACIVALLTFASGALASVELTRAVGAGSAAGLEIVGSLGRLHIDIDGRDARLRVTTDSGTRIVPGSETADYWAAGVQGELEFFSSRIRAGGSAGPSAADSAASVRIGREVAEHLARGPHRRAEPT